MLNIILFILGLLGLLLGLYILKQGLYALNSLNLRKIITSFTRTPLIGCLTGTGLTMLLQSSSAVTVIAIGLVDTGLLTFAQTIGIILGTNIGTTFTGQIMAFNFENFSAPIVIMGLILLLTRKTRVMGLILLSLGIIFFSMGLMSSSFLFIESSPIFYHLILYTNQSTLLAISFGIIFTAIIQSSSAMTGIVLALAKTGQLNLVAATGIILGSNIGTCVTAVLACLGSSKGGKRVAAFHVVLNLVGVLALLPFIEEFAGLIATLSNDLPRQVAHMHTIFNILCSLIILPITSIFNRFICWLIPG